MPAKSKVRLTKTIVDSSALRAKRYVVYSGMTIWQALLFVLSSGTKSFVVRYRADGCGRTTPQRYVTIDRFGNLTVEEDPDQAIYDRSISPPCGMSNQAQAHYLTGYS